MNTFDLSHIGAELDASRRYRATSIPSSSSRSDDEVGMDLPGLSSSVESHTSTILEEVPDDQLGEPNKTKVVAGVGEGERPYPLCLLCLSRPPSAVLLPCCHLNLCYLCAPLLIHRSTQPTFPPTTQIPHPSPLRSENASIPSSSPVSSPDCPKIPYNQLLYRATRNHPNARMLGLGGYRPPAEDQMGGEYTGQGVLGLGTSKENFGEHAMMDDIMKDGRISLNNSADDHGAISTGRDLGRPKCLVCRAGVKGWLRVYTG